MYDKGIKFNGLDFFNISDRNTRSTAAGFAQVSLLYYSLYYYIINVILLSLTKVRVGKNKFGIEFRSMWADTGSKSTVKTIEQK